MGRLKRIVGISRTGLQPLSDEIADQSSVSLWAVEGSFSGYSKMVAGEPAENESDSASVSQSDTRSAVAQGPSRRCVDKWNSIPAGAAAAV